MTQTHDPILQSIGTFCRRLIQFCALTMVVAVALWTFLVTQVFYRSYAEVWSFAVYAFDPNTNPTTATIFWGCATVALQFVVILFLLAALWWRRKGSVHRRGSTLVDTRAMRDPK
jgi:hypothetical protein